MRTEDKVMNNVKLQAKQEKLKSLHCPSPQSSLFNPRASALRSRSPALSPPHGAQSPSLSSDHKTLSSFLSPKNLFIEVSIELFRRGQSVRFRAPGRSMHPTIRAGETITVAPVASFDIKQGDILLYLVGRKVIAHRVVSIKRKKGDSTTQSSKLRPQHLFLMRGDASSTCDGSVKVYQVLGKVVSVEKGDRSIDLYSRKARMLRIAHACSSRLKRRMIRIFIWLRGLFNWARLICHRFRQRMFDSKDSIKGVQK